MRVLAIAGKFSHAYIDYLSALGQHCDLATAYSGEGQAGSVAQARREGLGMAPLGRVSDHGRAAVRLVLEAEVRRVRPDIVHLMYYAHDEVTVLTREVFDGVMIYECRDPLTIVTDPPPSAPVSRLARVAAIIEKQALQVSDAHILVSRALHAYLESRHHLTLPAPLIVPHCYSHTNMGTPQPKLSDKDGRTHIALVGSAVTSPRHGRYYGDIIRRLVALGFVVHSHFLDMDGHDSTWYRSLSETLADYHCHPPVSYRDGLKFASLTSQYDLMGVFYHVMATEYSDAANLRGCMPTKAVSGWVHGGLPTVCFPYCCGLLEPIQELGIGFVVESWADLAGLATNRTAIRAATARVLEVRDRFTHRAQAARVADFYQQCWPEEPGRRSRSIDPS